MNVALGCRQSLTAGCAFMAGGRQGKESLQSDHKAIHVSACMCLQVSPVPITGITIKVM